MKKLKYIKLFESFDETINKEIFEALQEPICVYDLNDYDRYPKSSEVYNKFKKNPNYDNVDWGGIFGLESKIQEIITKLKESSEIKKVVSDFIKRFGDKDGYINKQSDKVYGQTLDQLLGKIYQASKNVFDFKEEVKNDKGHIMPPSEWLSGSHPCHRSLYIGEEITGITYGQIMASIINKNLVEITGLTEEQLPSGSTDNWSYRQKVNAPRFSDYRG